MDAKGVVVRQQQANLLQGSNQLRINTKDLPAGAYFVSAEWNGERKSAQIVKD
jgi:ERCC4-type nuclease